MDEKVKGKLEIWSFILSIFAIIISFASFGYTIYKDNLDDKEQIAIINSRYGYNESLIYNSAGGYQRGQGSLKGVNYTVIVSNNSKQRISITDYNIEQQIENIVFRYEDMVNLVKNNENQEVKFPISLDSGEAIALTYELTTLISPKINMLIMDKYGVENEIEYDELVNYLGENGTDMFGNEVKYVKFADGGHHIEIDNPPSYPSYNLNLITAKGGVFDTVLTQMVLK